MKIETLEVAGVASAIDGMRNPLNSWDKSDSEMNDKYGFIFGKKDVILAKKLIKSGAEHRKFLRMIQVWADFNMPRYWWSEFDTYHHNTKNSCSTMHTLLSSTISENMFVYSNEDTVLYNEIITKLKNIQNLYILTLNNTLLKSTHDNCIIRAKRILPEGFLQLRTVNTNYEELMNIYHQRKNHKLKDEWQDTFCKWCEGLPYFKELCVDIN